MVLTIITSLKKEQLKVDNLYTSMKYCIYKDQPMPTWAGGEKVLTGCEIFGVHHNCENCPNLKEMGDDPYNSFSTIEEKK